jgi:hypothetical protein
MQGTGGAENERAVIEERSALDSILDQDLEFFEFLNDLNDLEDDYLTNAPWGDGEVDEGNEEDGWGWDQEYEHDRIQGALDELEFRKELEALKIPEPVPAIAYVKKPIPAKLRWAVFRRDGYRCVKCGCDEDLTADHIHPEVKGGRTGIGNLQTLCRPCNSKKGAR